MNHDVGIILRCVVVVIVIVRMNESLYGGDKSRSSNNSRQEKESCHALCVFPQDL